MTRLALVTGANGFVGTALTARLRAQGWTVRGAVHAVPAGAEQATCDVRDPEQVERLFAWAGPVTHVFHLAAIAFVPEASKDPVRAFDINLNGTVRVAAAVSKLAPKARMLFVGTSGVYGPPQFTPVTEDHPFNPQSPYDISKAAADQFLAYDHRATGLDVVRMRAFNHSGPGQSEDFVLSNFARQIARIEAGIEELVLRVGNLEARRDFSHVDDIVRAYELAALEGKPGAVYNVCSGEAHSVREALDALLRMSAAPIRVEVEASRLRAVEVDTVVGAHDKLTADTGWLPEISFEQLLRELLEYWRERLK